MLSWLLYNLFWHQDVSDESLEGAPTTPGKPSPEYKAKVVTEMERRIRYFFDKTPNVAELGFANEAYWEYKGNTGYEDSPYYRVFGTDWVSEAYIMTYKIALEYGRVPGKDLILFYSDYNNEVGGIKTEFVYKNMAALKKRASQELGIENPPLVIDLQLHIDFNNPPKAGELYVGDVSEQKLSETIQKYGELGDVWIGEFTIRGGTREQRTDITTMVLNACINTNNFCESITFWELMSENGYYADGDLLFDRDFNRTETYDSLVNLLKETIP